MKLEKLRLKIFLVIKAAKGIQYFQSEVAKKKWNHISQITKFLLIKKFISVILIPKQIFKFCYKIKSFWV